ncbi:MAG: GDSL-type esterase/lipase family protein [bacterium]
MCHRRVVIWSALLSVSLSVFAGCHLFRHEETVPDWVRRPYRIASDGKIIDPMGELFLKRSADFAQDAKTQQPGGIVLLGDSLTEGFPVDEIFPNHHVINRGISGDKIGGWKFLGVINRLDTSVFNLKPKKLFLMIGINDIIFWKTPMKEKVRGYKNLLGTLKTNLPDCEIYVQSLLPTTGKYLEFNQQGADFTKTIEKLTKDYGFTYLNLRPSFSDDRGQLREEFSKDGAHLTRAGYEQWKKDIMPYIEETP